MTIATGQHLPEATVVQMGENGPEQVTVKSLTAGRNVVIFGFPGAFTGTCTTAHVPSFIREMAGFKAKGVEVIGICVNDPFVVKAFGTATGATAAGISLYGDARSEFTKAIGLAFSNPAVGFADRALRYALYAEDGEVKVLHQEKNPGICDLSGGAAMLAAI